MVADILIMVGMMGIVKRCWEHWVNGNIDNDDSDIGDDSKVW